MKLSKTPLCFFVVYLTCNILSPTVLAQSYSRDRTWQTSQRFQPPVDQRNNPDTIGAATRFKPPADDKENPETIGAATRGSSCLNQQAITPLLPNSQSGITVVKNPTLFWNIPKSTAKTAEFILLTNNPQNKDDQKVVYKTILNLPEQSGIVSLTLPEKEINLEANSSYRWYLTIICDPDDSSRNPFVEGVVKRIPKELPLLNVGEKNNLLQQASSYAQAGIWYDALTSLVTLRCQKPNDPVVKAHWQQFLDSAELNQMESEPILNFCMQESTTKN
ncbi:MAG: DUF928 domain-containing protein [Nostocales cyanobacterium]|nr:MAG: DUF928 domain-containing protein [Nostocales cyanobacterium]TAF12497.1 MAG: DUF928 domain-containing protein [Nostocales cyanobacterium]